LLNFFFLFFHDFSLSSREVVVRVCFMLKSCLCVNLINNELGFQKMRNWIATTAVVVT